MADKDKGTPLGQHHPAAAPHPAPGVHPPGIQQPGLHSPADRGARATDDKAHAEGRAGETVTPYTADVVATPPSSPPHLGGKQVSVLMGPYHGNMLIMPEAEADQAIADHWAVEAVHSFDAVAEPPHDPLTDAEREAAYAAALAWAEAQQPQTEPIEPPVEPPPEEPPAAGETEAQRNAREKRNADAKAEHARARADYERRKAAYDRRKADDKALHPAKPPGGGYETRATAGRPPSR
jgi:hypothetical protein